MLDQQATLGSDSLYRLAHLFALFVYDEVLLCLEMWIGSQPDDCVCLGVSYCGNRFERFYLLTSHW